MIDAAVLRRVGVDLYPNELETPLSEVRTFTRFLGGFAGNVATGLARLGVHVAIVSRVGADALAREGVDVRFLATDPYWQTPPTFCEVVIGNEEEVEAEHVDPPTLVLKRGERGATVYERGEETDVRGDAFAAALAHSLLQGASLVESVQRGTVAGAIVASRRACSEAMPRLDELEAALV